jgi:hypothetical protein
MARTLQQQLDAVDAAIQAIEERGQDYDIGTSGGNRSLARAKYDSLVAERARLEIKVEREARGGIRVRGGTPVT